MLYNLIYAGFNVGAVTLDLGGHGSSTPLVWLSRDGRSVITGIGVARVDPRANDEKGAGSLRSVLLRGLAVLLTVALVALAAVMLVFVPRMPSLQVLIPALLTVVFQCIYS